MATGGGFWVAAGALALLTGSPPVVALLWAAHVGFDRGYITVTPDHHVLVAKQQLKDDFDNGEPYAPAATQNPPPVATPNSSTSR